MRGRATAELLDIKWKAPGSARDRVKGDRQVVSLSSFEDRVIARMAPEGVNLAGREVHRDEAGVIAPPLDLANCLGRILMDGDDHAVEIVVFIDPFLGDPTMVGTGEGSSIIRIRQRRDLQEEVRKDDCRVD